LADPAEQLAGALLQLLARGDVDVEARTRQEQRALGVEDLGIDHANRAARLSVERDEPARRQAVDAALPRVLANGVVDDLQALATGDALHFRGEVLPRVEDRLVGAGLPRELGLLFGGHGADHLRTAQARDLAEDQADAARRGVHQTGVTLLQRIRGAREIVRGHALQHDRLALLRLRLGHVLQLHHFGTAGRVDADGFHAGPPERVDAGRDCERRV